MKKLLALAAVALATVSANHASATVVLSDNFDSYANNAAFLSAWPATIGVGGVLSTAQAATAPNSINFGTAALRNDRSYTETGNPSATNFIRFSVNFYDSNGAAFPYRQISSLIDGAAGSSGQLVSLGLNNTLSPQNDGGNYYMARILGYTPTYQPSTDASANPATSSGASFKLNDAGAPLRSTGWHNLKVEIGPNLTLSTSLDYKFFVDNIPSETVTVASATFRSFDIVRLGSGVTSAQIAYFDDVLVETFNPAAVPEASAFLAVGLIGLVYGGARWTRQRRRQA
jgi:hypothetical protein